MNKQELKVGDHVVNKTDNCSGVIVSLRPTHNLVHGVAFMDPERGAVIKVDGDEEYDGCYLGHRWVFIDECLKDEGVLP